MLPNLLQHVAWLFAALERASCDLRQTTHAQTQDASATEPWLMLKVILFTPQYIPWPALTNGSCLGLLSFSISPSMHSFKRGSFGGNKSETKAQSVWMQPVVFECALSVNEAGECGGVSGCQLLLRAGRTACFCINTFLSSKFYAFAVNVLDRSAHFCHNISDTVCNPFLPPLTPQGNDLFSPGCFVFFRLVLSDVAAILWRFPASCHTDFHEHCSAERSHMVMIFKVPLQTCFKAYTKKKF